MATYTVFTIDQGSNFTSTISLMGGDGLPLDITSRTARGQMRKNYTSLTYTEFTISIVDANSGKIQISLDAETTRALKAGRYVFDIELLGPDLIVTRVLEGQIEVTPAVTREIPVPEP